jgi:HlyD family secretion protein
VNVRPQLLWRCVALSIGVLTAPGCREESGDLFLVGTVERTLLEISSPVAEVIVEVPVARGQHVEAGAVLVRLDPLLAEADLAAAQAAVAGAQTQSEVAEQGHRRGVGLHRSGVASDEVLDRARLAHDEARAGLRSAMARMSAAQKRLNDTTLRAPASATVDQIPFDVGERVAAGSVVAVLLADGRPWVRVWVPERAFARVGPGTVAEVRIDGISGPLRARVLDLAREPAYTPHYALTERERVYLVYQARIEIEDAPAALRPGAPAEVRIALPPLAAAKSPL